MKLTQILKEIKIAQVSDEDIENVLYDYIADSRTSLPTPAEEAYNATADYERDGSNFWMNAYRYHSSQTANVFSLYMFLIALRKFIGKTIALDNGNAGYCDIKEEQSKIILYYKDGE